MDAWRFFFLLLTFQLTNAACNGGERIFLRINETKTINSPNYPLNYPNNANCSWTFETEHSIRGRWDEYYVIYNYVLLVRLTIYELDINNNNGYCKKDYLSFNGWLKLCKAGTESFLLADYRTTVNFISDQQQTGKGFQLTVTAVEACGGLKNITADRYQWLTAPTYPRLYPSFVSCAWPLTATNGDLIEIKSFGDSCSSDLNAYVSFTTPVDSSIQEVNLCSDNEKQTNWTFPSSVIVRFDMWANVNFNLRVGTMPHPDPIYAACNGGGRIFLRINETKTINSPNYPLNYPNNANCSWTFETERSRRYGDFYYIYNYVLLIRLTIYELDTNNDGRNCKKDYLSIDGWLKRCKAKAESFLFDDYRKTVKFRSDQKQTGKGFQVTVTAVEKCGGQRNITAGRYEWLTAPTYPRPFPDHSCVWYLKTTNDDLIEIKSFSKKSICRHNHFMARAYYSWKSVNFCSVKKNQRWTFPSPVKVHFDMWANVNFSLRVGALPAGP